MGASTRISRSARALLLGAAVALVGVSLGGCDSCKNSATPPVDAGNTSRGVNSLTPELAAKVLAKVGDKNITLGDYVAVLDRMDQFDRLRYQSPERRKELLDEIINVELLAQEATAKGYDKDPVAQEELRQILRDAMLADTRKDAPKPADIPVAEVRAYFDAHRADYKDPERRRVSVIILRDEATAAAVLKAAKTAQTPAAFGELVKQKSVDPQAKANVPVDLLGDVGIVSPPGDARGENTRVPEPVRVALFELKAVGDVYDKPVKVGERYFVLRLSGKTEARERAFEEAERVIRVKLAQDKIRDREKALLGDLRKEFPVQVDDNALAGVRVDWAPDGGALPPVDAGMRSPDAAATTVDAGKH